MHLEPQTLTLGCLNKSTKISFGKRIHLCSHIHSRCRIKKYIDFVCLAQLVHSIDKTKHKKLAPIVSFAECNIGKQSGTLHLMKVQSETPFWNTGLELSLLDTHDQGVLEWRFSGTIHIPEGPVCNHSHVTAIGIMDRRTPNLDHWVIYGKVWGILCSCLKEHEMCAINGFLRQRLVHVKLKKTPKKVFAVLSSSFCYFVSDFWAKLLNES